MTRGLAAVAALVWASGGLGRLSAQTPEQVRDGCVDFGGSVRRCTDAALSARAIAGQFGLLSGWGSEIPGSASTLGRKLGNRPRLSMSLRAGGMAMGLPDLFDEGTGAAPDVSFLVPALGLQAALGLLDGFSPMSTVGGVLSLDLLGSLGMVMPPSSQGFGGNVTSASLGARVGLLRESFTLPGVSVSLSRRFIGASELGNTDIGDPTALDVDPALTSVRATVGKDLVGVGLLAGIGWDIGSADVVVEVAGAGPTPARVTSSIDIDRRLFFAGASLTFVLLQLSIEGGWAEGAPALPGATGSVFDPTAGSAFGSLALRFTP